ncbi:MAG TPA: tRNA (adenosine(37)-N6)-threonylcarbamoyltransferase complex dimerization subunit type 1 TsaB [Tepidisphaeraceae bacterium]|nr:tRNA (adenosine(37)-N6)-threonylcarbamoyltransferase complex dimerization subunit type 1 TsaB [Tepidisphaeraceae bacterium]
MIRALAIETSGRIGSVAICADGKVLAEQSFQHGLQHAARILPEIDALCRAQSWQPSQIDELYVSTGPGSFTGLRIGVTMAKAMAISTGVRLVAVPTLGVLAANAPPEATNLIIVLDAKRNQIFTARFERMPGQAWTEKEPAHLDDLSSMLSRSGRPVWVLGEGIPWHEKFIDRSDSQIRIVPPTMWQARASAVAAIGWELARAGQFADPMTLTPVYVRRPEAEEKWHANQSNRDH